MKLQVKDLEYTIDHKKILSDISLNIEEGEFVGLVGPNGCGKSTLLKNIYKVLKPDEGIVYIDGEDIGKLNSKETAKRMSVMVQETNVEFDMNVLDMVLLGRYAHKKMFGDTSKSDLEIARESLAKVGMSEYEDRSFLSLSGGEKQRILVARLLTQQAKFVILDEPTNHLDIGYQFQIMNILKRQDITVFSSIHDLNIAALYCDKIIVMKKGNILCHGTPKEVLTPELIQELFGIQAQITVNTATGKLQIYYIPNPLFHVR